jgi:hypothetical protein
MLFENEIAETPVTSKNLTKWKTDCM